MAPEDGMRQLRRLRLMQLADSALPLGATAHSFGLETLVAWNLLTAETLEAFLREYVEEAGALEAAFCRWAHRLAARWRASNTDDAHDASDEIVAKWLDLNAHLSALKPARESRAASATLGRRFLRLVLDLAHAEPGCDFVRRTLQASQRVDGDIHHCMAFGFVLGALALDDEEMAALTYLQQSLSGLVSACQRLLPLGQSHASAMLWRLKPALVAAVDGSRTSNADAYEITCFTPLVDLGGMRHPGLETRLFIS